MMMMTMTMIPVLVRGGGRECYLVIVFAWWVVDVGGCCRVDTERPERVVLCTV